MRLGSILVVALAALLLAAAAHAYGLQPMGQCISQTYNWAYQGPTSSYVIPLWHGISNLYFTEAGTVRLIIRADVSSNAPVELAILDSQGQKIWAIGPSTRIAGTYTVYLKAPGDYRLGLEKPRSYTAFINVTMCGEPVVKSWLGRYMEAPWRRILNKTITSVAPWG